MSNDVELTIKTGWLGTQHPMSALDRVNGDRIEKEIADDTKKAALANFDRQIVSGDGRENIKRNGQQAPTLRDLTDDEIMDIYNEGPLYHVPMHEHKYEAEREEEKIALLMFARDIIAISRELSECEWTHNEDEGAWSTGCGAMFVFNNDGTPADHGMHYCYSCGSKIAKKEQE